MKIVARQDSGALNRATLALRTDSRRGRKSVRNALELSCWRLAGKSEVRASIELQIARAGKLPGACEVERLLSSCARRIEIRVHPIFRGCGQLG